MQGDADERKHAKPAQADASAVRVLVNAARLTCRGQDILEGTRFIVGQRDINKLISRIPNALPRISPACFATVCDYDYAMLGAWSLELAGMACRCHRATDLLLSCMYEYRVFVSTCKHLANR